MNIFFSELIGTALMLLFGGGVVANVLLEKTKEAQGGWLVITLGWALAVLIMLKLYNSFEFINPVIGAPPNHLTD